MKMIWKNIGTYESRSYTCGYCGNPLSSEKAFLSTHIDTGSPGGTIYICHFCTKPTFFDIWTNNQTPGPSFGNDVGDIDDEGIKELYNEARRCYSANSFTSVVLACRKLLMHIAVSKGAKEGLNFIQYVEYLAKNNYIPPDAIDWVDHIRSKGNEANHEIVVMKKEDAEDLLSFIEMLLKMIYEFPANIKKKKL